MQNLKGHTQKCTI